MVLFMFKQLRRQYTIKMGFTKLIIFINVVQFVHSEGYYKSKSLTFLYPQGSSKGIFLAVALPLDLPNKSAYLAYNFEANYALPYNSSDFEYPPLVQGKSQGIDRQIIYDVIEAKMESSGISGKPCLLRMICEASTHTLEYNGVLGDILHILFTPSTSKNPNSISSEYEEAEKVGKTGSCNKYNKNCPVSFLNLFSIIGHMF